MTPPTPSTGELVIIGLGIVTGPQITAEARDQIKAADIVFYNPASAVMASLIHQQNANAVDLSKLYGEGKRRRETYVQMAELMLREVRAERKVVGAFPGHAGFLNMPARRALAIAKDEGYPARMLAGISSVDCLVCDLGIDPGLGGLHILKAGSYLREGQPLATGGHVALMQVSSVGDSAFSFSGFKDNQFASLILRLIEDYGEAQEAVYYVAAIYPWSRPVIRVHPLSAWRDGGLRATGGGILYLPAKGMTFDTSSRLQAFQGRAPYDETAEAAIAALPYV